MKRNLFCIAVALLMTTAVVAQDAPAKKKRANASGRNNAAAAVLKQLQDVELTAEQKAEIQTLAKKTMAEMRTLRQEAGITPELMKQRTAAVKELRESGTKPAEMSAAVAKKIGLSEAQAEALKKADAMRRGLITNVIALLTDEQQANLPKRMLRLAKKPGEAKGAGQPKGKGNKKKSE